MSKVAIITDSTAYLPDDILEELKITVVPQVLIWGGEEFMDGVDIKPDEFYTRLSKATVMPSTSQVTPQSFIDAIKPLHEQGYETLSILLSDDLSGTIKSAIQAKDLLPEDAVIEIFDSRTTAMALGFQVLMVARAAAEGASMRECLALAEQARDRTGVVFAVDTLEFLHRGGRIGTGSKFLGTALNIKPILEVTGGKVEGIEKVRTRKKSLNRLVELLDERIKGRQPVRLATLHANAEEDAQQCLNMAIERFNPIETIFSTVSPVIGTHAGPGTVGLAYLVEM
jgi:DegV family protein with EDD domain